MARKARSMMAKCSRATAGDLARRLRTARSGYPPRESVTRSTSTRDGPLPCAHVSATHTPSDASPISAHNRRTRQRSNPKQAVHRGRGGGRGRAACHICRQRLGHKRRVLHLLQPQFYPLSDRCETSGSMEVVWLCGTSDGGCGRERKEKNIEAGTWLVERNMVGGNGTMLVEHLLLCKTGGGLGF